MIESGGDSATFGMAHDNDQSSAQVIDCIFDTGDNIGVDDVAGDTDDKEIAESLVEYQFRWNA